MYLPTAESQLVGTLTSSINDSDATPTWTCTFKDNNLNTAREPTSTTRIFVIDTGGENFEIFYGTHSTASGVTTITTVARGLPKDGSITALTAVAANKKSHFAGATVGVYDIATFLNLIVFKLTGIDAIDSDLTFSGDNTIADTKKLQFGAAAAYIVTDNTGTDLKFKDGNNAETTLSQLTAAAGVDTKVRVSANDTTSGFLNGKLLAGGGISGTEGNDGGDETFTLAVDITDTDVFVKTSSGAGDENKIAVLDASGKLATDFVSNTLQNLISDIGSTTGTELAQLAGISANVTDTNLNTLTSGITGYKSFQIREAFTEGQAGYLRKDGGFAITGGGTSTFVNVGTAASSRAGQTFLTLTTNIGVHTLTVNGRKIGTPTDNLIAKIYASDKTTLLGTSDALDGSTVPSTAGSYNPIVFTFSTICELSPATTYFVEISRSGASNDSNYWFITGSGGNTYIGGDSFYYNGSWNVNSTDFAALSMTSYDGTKMMLTDANDALASNIVGFALEAGDADDTIRFALPGSVVEPVITSTPSTNGIAYLSDTAGSVSPSAGTNTIKIGRFLSATEVLFIPPPL